MARKEGDFLMLYDYQIRDYFHEFLTEEYTDRDVILDEFSICSSRIDIAVINGSFVGFEIKSKKDTLQRLDNQILDYLKVFDKLSLCIDVSHYSVIRDSLPNCIGIYVVENNQMHSEKKPLQNKDFDNLSIARLLWNDELKGILEEKGLRGLSKKIGYNLPSF